MKLENNPVISVVMTTYNHEKYIAEAVQSVLEQTYKDFELVIVNDGSTDKTEEIIKGFNDKRIHYIYQENMGPSECANTAIRNARGQYIALMSGDDVCYHTRLEKQLEEYNKKNNIILFSHCDFIDDDSALINGGHAYTGLFNRENKCRAEILRYFFYFGNYLCAPTVFLKKDIFDEIGCFDNRLLQIQDFDMWVKALLSGFDIEVIPEKLIKYRIRTNNKNLSALRKDSSIRSQFEFRKMLKRYLSITNKDEFLSIFPEAKKICEQFEVKDIPFYILYLAYSGCNNRALKEFAIETFFEVLDSEYYIYLKNKYDFNIKTFYSYTGSYEKYYSQLYIDSGNGFNEYEKIVVERNIGHDHSYFDLTKWKNIKALRFDPCEGIFCRFKLNLVETDGVYAGIKYNNSISQVGERDIFYTDDPQYEFQGDFTRASWIKIDGEIEEISNHELTEYINVTRGRFRVIQRKFVRLYNSYLYRFSVMLRKITDKTGLLYPLHWITRTYKH